MPEPGWKVSVADGSTKDPRARWLGRRTAVLFAVVATASVWVVASGGPIVVVASPPADHIMVVLRLASIAEAVVNGGGLEAIVHRGPFRGVPTPSRREAFGLLYRGGLEKVSELAVDPSPLQG